MCILEPIEHNVTGLKLSLRWGDQNWGEKKGFFKICRRRRSGWLDLDCWDSRPHLGYARKMKAAKTHILETQPLVANFEPGDSFHVKYNVGGGGDYELYLKRFLLAIERPSEDGQTCEEPKVKAHKGYCQCSEPDLGHMNWVEIYCGIGIPVSVVLLTLAMKYIPDWIARYQEQRSARIIAREQHAALFNGSTDLRVRTLAGDTCVVRCDPSDSIARVQQRIHAQLKGSPPAESLRLVCASNAAGGGLRVLLEAGRTLADYPRVLQEGALVHLVATAGDAGEADEWGQGDANARAAPQNPGAIVPQIARAAALI